MSLVLECWLRMHSPWPIRSGAEYAGGPGSREVLRSAEVVECVQSGKKRKGIARGCNSWRRAGRAGGHGELRDCGRGYGRQMESEGSHGPEGEMSANSLMHTLTFVVVGSTLWCGWKHIACSTVGMFTIGLSRLEALDVPPKMFDTLEKIPDFFPLELVALPEPAADFLLPSKGPGPCSPGTPSSWRSESK